MYHSRCSTFTWNVVFSQCGISTFTFKELKYFFQHWQFRNHLRVFFLHSCGYFKDCLLKPRDSVLWVEIAVCSFGQFHSTVAPQQLYLWNKPLPIQSRLPGVRAVVKVLYLFVWSASTPISSYPEGRESNASFTGPTELFLQHERCCIQSGCQQGERAGWWPRESMAGWDRRTHVDLI